MYETFTDRARKVMHLANEEACRFNHEYLGTEHILLGVLKEGCGIASMVLNALEVDIHQLQLDVVEKIVKASPYSVKIGRLPNTTHAKNVIALAIEEARKSTKQYVGTEHLLLGLLCDTDGFARQVLMNRGVTYDRVNDAVKKLLESDGNKVVNSDKAPSSPINPVWTCSIHVLSDKQSTNSGLFVIRSCATSGDGKKQYWSCSPEHGAGWCAVPKQSFTKLELSKQIFDLIANGHFQNCEILELRVPE